MRKCYRYIMASQPAELRLMAKWDGKGPKAREKLMEQLQGTVLSIQLDYSWNAWKRVSRFSISSKIDAACLGL